MKYIKQLESLRAIAVIFVITCHWIPPTNIIHRATNWYLGDIGVDMFFVLSGFLITKILLDNRNKAEQLNVGKSVLIKNFYVRRCLRIFPIYYLILFFLFIFNEKLNAGVQPGFLYFATYTSNFYFFHLHTFQGLLIPSWSLAVEEQFYLIWPWLILFINKKYYLHIIISFIIIGILSQYLLINATLGKILTPACFDAFGVGALLSWQITYGTKYLKKTFSVLSVLSVIAFICMILSSIDSRWLLLPLRTNVSIISLWIITYIYMNHESENLRFKFIFNNKILIFLGKISYGLYLFHLIVADVLTSKIVDIYLNPLLPTFLLKKYWGQIFLIENTILVVLLSWFSYTFFESKFLNLKRFFETQKSN